MKSILRSLLALALLAGCNGASKKPDSATLTRDLDGRKVTVQVMGFESAWVDAPKGEPELVEEEYDAVIVGGGISGLTAAWYLRDKKVLCLERKDVAGGLAFRGLTQEEIVYGRGSAYYSTPAGICKKIYEELGMTPVEETAIPEPIDSYFRQGKLIRHMWEEEAFKQLPAGFKAFREAIEKADEKGWVGIQPIDQSEDLRLDKISAAEFLKPYGAEVKAYLDSYCQSALGDVSENLNALAFVNFYLSEIVTRHAWPGGSAGASVHLVKILNKHNPAILKTNCTVTRVKNVEGGVEVVYHTGGKNYKVRAKYAIMATPLRVTSAIMEDYPAERKELVSKLKYADYMVHSVFTSKDLYTDTYDTWFTDWSFTDVIAARWIETKGFTKPGKAGPGILSIYQPLAPHRKIEKMDPDTAADLAVAALKELHQLIPALKDEKEFRIESYRWPASIHIVPPGFFKEWVPKLTGAVGRVYMAGNNLGTPSFEEATYRGWLAAEDIRKKLLSRAPVRVPEHAGSWGW